MMHMFQRRKTRTIFLSTITAVFFAVVLFFVGPAHADDQRAVTIHDGEKAVTVTTHAETVNDVLKRADINVGQYDSIEPVGETTLTAPAYTVNVYRARPVTIVDGASQTKVMSPHQSARTIVTEAGLPLYDEDLVEKQRIDDFVTQGGPGVMITIDRAAPMTLVLYGKKIGIRTQAETVGQLLEEKGVKLGPKDDSSKPMAAPVEPGMVLDVYRNGVSTKTEEQTVPFTTRYIQDADKEVGFREVQQPGQDGKKNVTYEVKIKNGKEVARQEIASVITKQPREEVVLVGVKTGFSGGFAQALAQLRACEGGYDSWNPAGPYYGAYQFDQGTWASSAPPGAEYGNATPAEQDQAARSLYERRGWSPWPVCGASLPDIYR